MKTFVRCSTDRTVFEIDPTTTEALSCGVYDAYCYSDPRTDVVYVEYHDWLSQCDKRWDKYFPNSKRVIA